VKDVFEEGVKCLQEIPQLEPRLLHTLFKTHAKKTIKAPIIPQEQPKIPEKSNKRALVDENLWLWDAYQKLIENLERAIKPLEDYVHTFEVFKVENELNPDKHMKVVDDVENPMDPIGLKHDIAKHKKLEEELMNRIPESVNVGMFQINCKDIRNMYAAKYRDIQDKELKLIAQRAKDKNYVLLAQFGEIHTKVLNTPKTIDEMTDLKKYIQEQGITIEKMKKEIDECMMTYNILDEFEVELNSSQIADKWKLFGSPLATKKLMEQQIVNLDKLKEQMIKNMEQEQEEFEETLENIQMTVGSFAANDNLEKFSDIAKMVDEIELKLTECQDNARMYNQREFLVGKD